jgi:hypothetical protein
MDQQKLVELLTAYPENQAFLDRGLDEFTRKRQHRVFFLRFLCAAITIPAVTLFFLLLERTPIQSETWRTIISITLYALIVHFFARGIQALIKFPDPVDVAREIERALPDFHSSLISAVEFGGQATMPGTSSAMTKLTIGTVAATFGTSPIRSALQPYSPRRHVTALLFLLIILTLWGLLSPLEVVHGIKRLFNPFARISSFSPLEFIIEPGDRVAAKGEDIQIIAVPNQDPAADPVLTLFKPGQTDGTSTEMYPDEKASNTRYVYTLTGLQESTDYQVSLGKYISERFSITVLPRPEVKSLELTVTYPEYLEIAPQKLADMTGDCTIPQGSKLSIQVKASQKLASAAVLLTPAASAAFSLRGETVKAEFSPATSTRYSLFLQNEQGLANENPVQYQVTVHRDASPTVVILKPAADLPFPNSRRLDLKVSARDDFGVVSVVLFYSIGSRDSWVPLNMKSDFSPRREFEVDYPWLLDTIHVQPGTEIKYFVQAEDGFRPKPQIASTTVFSVSMPSMLDVYQGAEEAQKQLESHLKEYLDEQKLRQEALGKALEEIKHEKKLDFETERQMETLMNESREGQKKGEDILDQFQNFQERLKENPFSNQETLDKMQKISELLNQVLDDEAKKLMQRLQESLKDMKLDPKELEKLEDAFKMDEFVKSLDRTVELLEKLREDMRLNSLGNALEDLRRRQEMLASETLELEKKMETGALPPLEEVRHQDLLKQKKMLEEHFQEEQKRLGKEREALEKKQQAEGLSPDEQKEMEKLTEQLEALKKEFAEQASALASETALMEEKRNKGALSREDEARLNDLKQQQEKVRQELEKLQKQTEEMAGKKPPPGEAPDPSQENLKNLRDQMNKEDFRKELEKIKKELTEKNFSEAHKAQKRVLKFLESLAKEGQNMCNSCNGSPGKQLDLSRFIRRALQVSHDQEKLLNSLDGFPGQFMRGQMPAIEGRIDETSYLQLLVKTQGQNLHDALDAFVRSSFSINPEIMTPLNGTQRIFSEVVKDLEDRALEKAKTNQREIIRRFNHLAIELMKAQDQSQNSSSSNPMDALQQFKELTQRQLSLYQQMEKQKMSPANQQLMEQLKRMAMEQRKVREGLEKVTRENKGGRNVLGRLEDIINEMTDLETKILDPELRREVTERQKAVYDRMLKAQKSIRNRDEEEDERKAERAREIFQPEPEQPLPELGTDSRDLSRDYLSDLNEEYPRTYEKEIQDYYKSLNLLGNME